MKRRLKTPEQIRDTITDIEALKWFVNRTESNGAVLLYWDGDDLDGLHYGRTPFDVRMAKMLYDDLGEMLKARLSREESDRNEAEITAK